MHVQFSIARPLLGLLTGIGLSCIGMMVPNHATAAEQILFKYQALRESLTVKELTAFATTGTASPKLEVYLRLSQTDPQKIRQAFTNEVAVDAQALTQFLESWVGKLILDELSQIVRTGSGQSSKRALLAAIVLSSKEDNKFSLLEVFQNYPTPQVEIDIDRLIETNARINSDGADR